MQAYQRAWAYVSRKRKRSAIMLAVLALICICLYACVALHERIEYKRRQIQSVSSASLSIMRKDRKPMRVRDLHAISQHPLVVDQVLQYRMQAISSNLQVVKAQRSVQFDAAHEPVLAQRLFAVEATTNSAVDRDFVSGRFVLEQGRHIQPNETNVVLMHRALAERNRLRIGDLVSLQAQPQDSAKAPEKTKEQRYRIVGIFSGTKQEQFQGLSSDLSQNTVFMDFTGAQRLQSSEPLATASVYATRDEHSLRALQSALGDLLKKASQDVAKYEITPLKNDYQAVSQSLDSLRTLVYMMTGALIICGMAVLLLFCMLQIRERIKEIAILLSLGQKARVIIAQFISEWLYVSIPSLLVAILVGPALAANISKYYMQDDSVGVRNLSYSTLISLPILAQTYVVIVSMVCLVIVVGVGLFLRRSPSKILSNLS